MGKFFDNDFKNTTQDGIKDFSINFRSTGLEYMKDILLKEFNEVGDMFHPELRKLTDNDGKDFANRKMVKVPREHLGLVKSRSYPRVNLDTRELEWWIDIDNPKLRYIRNKIREGKLNGK